MANDFLNRFLQIERSERGGFALAFAYFFSLLCGYAMLRPVRSEMAVRIGVEQLPTLSAVVFITMLAVAPAFGWITTRFPRSKMLPMVYGFCVSNLVAFYFVFAAELEPYWTARVFFVWLSVYNMFIVSVFWSFMADLFTNAQGKRLFAVIAAGGSLGAVIGTLITQAIVKSVGIANLMLVSACFLFICIACIVALGRWATRLQAAHPAIATSSDAANAASSVSIPSSASAVVAPLSGSILAGVRIAFSSPYLLGVCAYLFLFTWTAATLGLEVTRIVGTTMPDSLARTQFFARIDLVVNLCTFLCQLFLTNRLIERLGLVAGLMFLPLVNLLGFAGMAFSETLATLVVFAVAQRVSEYAISKPSREVLFTVLDRESKYKAKNFIDTAIVRGGDALSGWSINAIKAAGLAGSQLAFLAMPVAALWAAIGWNLARQHAKRAARAEVEPTFTINPGISMARRSS